jgi:hypothetical protein
MAKLSGYLLVFTFLTTTITPSLFAQKGMNDADRALFTKELNEERKQKDEEMRSSDKSPIADEDKATFEGLRYFQAKPKYSVKAVLKRFDDPMTFKMKTTTDRLPEYKLYGEAIFKLHGKTFTLEVYQNVELTKKPGYADYLFIPFNDKTNGRTSYSGGRFIDANIPDGDTLIIDFNRAYNPYCAYNHKYSCPIPPENNNLKGKVRAGEKTLHKKGKSH